MPDKIRSTRATRRVLLVLLTGAPGLGGYTICHLAGTGPGRVYPALWRLERAGWIEGRWEERSDGKPRRRSYRLTRAGRAKATLLLGLPAGEAVPDA